MWGPFFWDGDVGGAFSSKIVSAQGMKRGLLELLMNEWREGQTGVFQVFPLKFLVIVTASDNQLFNLLSVSRLITVLDEADECI